MNRTRDDDGVAEPPGEGGFDGCNLPTDGALIAAGWDRRCVTDAAKSREMADGYTELGFEVRLEPVDTGFLCSDCDGCKDLVARFNAVYVRRSGA